MPDDVRAMGGMYREEIEIRFAEQRKQIDQLCAIVYGNGRPGIREELMSQLAVLRKEFAQEMEKESGHSKRNMQQGDLDARGESKRIEEKVDKMDERNGKKLDWLMRMVAVGIGAILTVQSLFAMGILHAAK